VDQLLVYLVGCLPKIGAYTMLGLGITVIYQASRVLNLAHGAMAMLAAYACYQLSIWGLPLPLAALGGIAAGGVLGLASERVLVRRLRAAGPTTQTVGTVAALTLSIALATRLWGSLPVPAPRLLPRGALFLPGGFVPWALLGIFPVALVAAALLFGVFQLSDIGLAMRGAAQNRRGAALRGVDPDRTAAMAWTIAGALAGVAGILLAGATSLDPFSLSLGALPAFVAALIGGLESLPGVCIGAAIVGTVEGMVPAFAKLPALGPFLQGEGSPELVLGVVALLVMAWRGARLSVGDVRQDSL
jgi:branched-subunit amino acid ABC-type transport system permease component